MNKAILIISLSIFLVSCASVQHTEMETIGAIARPDISFNMQISLNEKNINALGPIEESIELKPLIGVGPSTMPGNTETTIKRVYIANLLSRDDGIAQLRNQNPVLFDTALSELAGRCLVKYPDLDYILFPKIQLEITGNSGFGGQNISIYRMKLTGTAVQLKLN